MVTVKKISDKTDFDAACKIRKEVFVVEQKVDPALEFDEHETFSSHFLALDRNEPVGTARWRFTDKGIKLERFAVLKSARGKGVGAKLVEAVLQDIEKLPLSKKRSKYLHAQLAAISLYKRFGFQEVGEKFLEADLWHTVMEKV